MKRATEFGVARPKSLFFANFPKALNISADIPNDPAYARRKRDRVHPHRRPREGPLTLSLCRHSPILIKGEVEMPSAVPAATYQSHHVPSSYLATSSSRQSGSGTVHVGVGVTETTPSGDTVEISDDAASGQGEGSQGGTSAGGSGVQVSRGGTYTPRALSDRFRYDINNGFLSPRQRFRVSLVSAGSEAAATYAVRGQAGGLVRRGGVTGVYGAIFSLGYQDGSPGGTGNGISNRQAINEFRRMADQNLPLLSAIG